MPDQRIIAFYLPQFHPIPENDDWWGKGFTEWTNVGKAKKLYPSHHQPKIPTELGYYDLRLSQIYDEQVNLAKECGIEGFCFWHYYFGNGRQLLEKPIYSVVQNTHNSFPFCLGWANESWEKKLWNKDSKGNITLVKQEYNGLNDYKVHFDLILPILRDSRYITIDGKLIFFIYKPNNFSQCKQFITYWRNLAHQCLNKDFHFIAQADVFDTEYSKYFEMGFDGVYSNSVQKAALGFNKKKFTSLKYLLCKLLLIPRLVNFNDVITMSVNEIEKEENIYPGIICGWDHTPRSGIKGYVYTHFNLKNFMTHIKCVFEIVKNKQPEHKIIFLKSWNEWGEGNFMEPDIEFGRGKIETLAKLVEPRT